MALMILKPMQSAILIRLLNSYSFVGDTIMQASIIFDLSKLDQSIREQIETSPKYRDWFTRKPAQMLGLDNNAKTVKGNKRGFKTAILYLVPASQSGQQLCPNAKLAACDKACLFTAGRGAMSSVFMSRLWRTLFFLQYKDEAIELIKKDIARYHKASLKGDWDLLVRLNGTSDIRWENYGIMQAFPNVQFYDYTKLANRKGLPDNYDLSFSYSGLPAYQSQVQLAIQQGMRVAVVFRHRDIVDRLLGNSESFLGMPVVDGDDTDIRHLDPQASVVALYAKGKAIKDSTGFVVG